VLVAFWIGAATVGLAWWVTGRPIGPFAPLIGLELAVIGVSLAALAWFELPQHVLAWRRGAIGEGDTARVLARLPPGFVVLHDRSIPGSKANIDHIVIGPPGVFVVETKRYSGRLTIRGNDIFVAGRRRTEIIEQTRREADVVRRTLDSEGEAIEVTPLLCIHRADPPWRTARVGGVDLVSGRELQRSLTKGPDRLSTDEVRRIAAILDLELRPVAPS
jgi:hypothetical protein